MPALLALLIRSDTFYPFYAHQKISYSDSQFLLLALRDYFWKRDFFWKKLFFIYIYQMCFIWLRCSCQAFKTFSYIYQKIMIELHWTMEMPRDMKWSKTGDFRKLSLLGKTYRHRVCTGKHQCLHWKTTAVKRNVEANDMADEKSPLQHHVAFLSGNNGPVPCSLVCFWASLCSNETISLNFLINMCPC